MKDVEALAGFGVATVSEAMGRTGLLGPGIRPMGRFGAVFGPWLGGRLLAANHDGWGFAALALAGLSSMVLLGTAALRGGRKTTSDSTPQELVTTH